MPSIQEARGRHPLKNIAGAGDLHILQHALALPQMLPDFAVGLHMGTARKNKAAILQPQLLWDTVLDGVVGSWSGAGREFDKAEQLIKSMEQGIVPALKNEHPVEVMPFITIGQNAILEQLHATDDQAMRQALERLYFLTQNDGNLAASWSQILYDSAVAMARGQQNGQNQAPAPQQPNFVEQAVIRMQNDIFGSDGQHPIRDAQGRSPFANDIVRLTEEDRVTHLSMRQRTRIHETAERAVLEALESANGPVLERDLRGVMPALESLVPHQSTGFDLTTAARTVVERQRAAVQPVAVNPGPEANAAAVPVLNTDRQIFDEARITSETAWRTWTNRLADARTGFETAASTAEAVIQQITDTQTEVAKLAPPVQAAFIQESLAAVRRILEIRPTREAVNLYDRLHEVLPDGWRYFRRFIQIEDTQGTLAQYAQLLNNGTYGVDGAFSIRQHLRQELHDLAAMADDINAEASLDFFRAAQSLKPVITAQSDPHARDFAANIYTDVVRTLTHAPEAMATSLTVLPNGTALEEADREGRRAYADANPGELLNPREQEYAGRQAQRAVRQAPALAVLRTFVDSMTNDIYGLEGVSSGVSGADAEVFASLRVELGRRGNALEAQALFLETAEEQMLISLRNYQSTRFLQLLTDTMADTHLERGLVRLQDARMADPSYFTYLAEMYADPEIGLRAQVSAALYLEGQVGALIARARARGSEVEGQLFLASESLLGGIDRSQDGTTCEGLRRMFDQCTDSERAVQYLADQMARRLDECRAQVIAGLAGKSFKEPKDREAAFEQAMDRQEEEVFGAFWKGHYERLVSPAYGKGGRGDVTVTLRRNADRFLSVMSKRDFVYAGGFLKAAVDQVYDRILVSGNDDEIMRLTFWMMDLVTTSPIAQEMKRRETTGEGTKGTKTIGRILTETVMGRARDEKNAIKKILVYIETRYEGPGKDQFSKPEFVMLLALWRMKMLMRTHVDGDTAGIVPSAEDWASLTRSTTAGLEMSRSSLLKGDDSAHLEQVIADLFASPAALVPFVPITIGIKAGRKGTDAVLSAAEEALTAAREAGKSPEEQFYAMLRTGAIAPLMAEMRIPWSKEVLQMLDYANQYPALGKSMMENIWRYFFDFARIVQQPPGISWVTDVDAAKDPKVRAQQALLLDRQFQIMESMVRDPEFNFGSAPIGMSGTTKEEAAALKRRQEGNPAEGDAAILKNLNERRKLVYKTSFALLRWGLMLGNREAVEDEGLKSELRPRYLELLGDILFDTENRFAPEIQTTAHEVLQKCFYSMSPEDVGAFFRNLAGRADHRLGQHVLIEGGRWQSLVAEVCLIAQGCERFVSAEDRKKGWRTEFGREAAKVTLELLEKWRGLGGPHALRSPIREIVSAEELRAISPGQENLGLAVAAPSFPHQAINVVLHFGDREAGEDGLTDAQRLAETFADIGQKDLLWRAMQTKELRPPREVGAFLAATEQVSHAATRALGRLVTDYLQTVRQVNAETGVRIEIDEHGRVVSLPEYPALTQRLATAAAEEREQLLSAVGIQEREKVAKEVGEALFKSLSDRDPVGLVHATLDMMREYGADVNTFVTEMLAAIKASGQVPSITTGDGSGNGKDGQVQIPEKLAYISTGENVGLVIASLFGQSLANRAITAEAMEGMLKNLFGNNAFVAGLTRAGLDAGGGTATAESIEEMRRVIIQGVVDVISDEHTRAQLVATLRSANEKRRADRISGIEGLLGGYDTAQIIMARELQTDEVSRIRRELAILRRVTETRFGAAEKALNEFVDVYPQLAEEFVRTQLRPAQVMMSHVRAYQEYQDNVASPDGILAQEGDAYDRGLAAVGVNTVTPLPTTQNILVQARGPVEAAKIVAKLNELPDKGQQLQLPI